MNFGYAILIVISGMVYFVRGIPTPDEMIADFNAAQKFYTSKAYDQALETYQQVNMVESPFLDEDKVTVEFGGIAIPVKDAALYKSGFTYVKLVEDEFEIIDSDEATDEEKEKAEKMVLEYVQKAVEFFDLAQERSNIEEFKAMAQNQIISAWYAVVDYDKVIQEGEKLIERYDNSPYILDAMYNIGWAYYDKKSYDESIEAFIKLTTRFPTAGYKSERALFQIGECYYDQEKYGDAVPYYELLVNKMRIDRLTPIEIQKIQRDKYSGLTDETALDLAAKAQLKIGACYANEGNYDDAKAAYRRVANLFKFDKRLISEAYQRMADMYYDRGDFNASVLSYRDAIDEIQDEIFRAKMQVYICKRYFTEGEKSNGEYYNDAIREYQYYIGTYSEVASRSGFKLDNAFFWLGRSFYEYGNFLLKKGEDETAYENFDSSLSTYQRAIKEFPSTDLLPRIYFYEALVYYRYGGENLTKSVNSFNLLLTEFPDTPYKEYCYFFIARANQTMDKYEEAISIYNKILEEFPETTELNSVFMEIATAYNKMNNGSEALKFFLKVNRDTPQLFTTARLLAAQYLLSQRDYNEVVNIITYAVEDTSAIESNHRLSQFYLLSGNANKNLENLEEAVADYTRAYDLKQPETQEMASVYRAGVFIEMDQLARAERDLKELVNSDNEKVRENARMRLAIISVRQDKSEQAIQTYQDLYESSEDILEKLGYLRNLIQLAYTSKDWDRMKEFADIMLNSADAEGKRVENQEFYFKEETYFNLALSYEAQEDFNTARDYLITGYEKFPNSFYSRDMLIKIGVYYLTKLANEPGAIDTAAGYFDKYIKTFPNTSYSEMAHYYLGLCYYNGRRFDLAYDIFRSFARIYPNSEFTPEAIFYYSDSYYNLGNLEECIDGFNIVISRYKNHEKAEESYYTKAWALMDLNREEEGIETLRQLIEKYPNSKYTPHSIYSIADYYYNEQDYQTAFTYYQQVMNDYPDSEVAEKVPGTLEDLKETIAYLDYEKAFNVFDSAKKDNDPDLYRQAAEMFIKVAEDFPFTESEIGAYSNAGICYEALDEWRKAVECYDIVIQRYEDGEELSTEAITFARQHKQYIEANKF